MEKARRNPVVAIELYIIERSCDPIPSRSGGRFDSANMRGGYGNDVTLAQGTADQNNFQFNACTYGNLFGTKKVDASRADIASYQCNRKFFRNSVDSAQSQRKLQGCSRIFALFRMNAYGVGRNARESPVLRVAP